MFRSAILMLTSLVVTIPAAASSSDSVKVNMMVNPSYPEGVALGGSVVEEVFILPTGQVGMTTQISGDPRFREATERALRQWVFEPDAKLIRRVLLEFTFYQSSYGGRKHAVVAELIPEKGPTVRLGPRLVVPLEKSYNQPMPTTCEIHHIGLMKDTVDMGYGLVPPNPEFEKAEERLFPYSNRYLLGGCVVQAENAAEVLYCPKCREAELEWLRVHKKER